MGLTMNTILKYFVIGLFVGMLARIAMLLGTIAQQQQAILFVLNGGCLK